MNFFVKISKISGDKSKMEKVKALLQWNCRLLRILFIIYYLKNQSIRGCVKGYVKFKIFICNIKFQSN